MTAKEKRPAPGTANKQLRFVFNRKDKHYQRITQILPPFSLLYNRRLNIFNICRTVEFFKGQRPEGIAVFRGTLDECLDQI